MSWHEQMNNAISYLEKHLFESINTAELNNIVGQSAERFSRTFSTVAGMTLCEYIRARRLSEAAKQVLGGESRIIDIALNCGYSSPEAFSRAFTSTYGISPAKARKIKPELKLFMPLSFKLTVKSEKEKAKNILPSLEAEEIKITPVPEMRLIGKRYTNKDLDADLSLASKWSECFQANLFGTLSMLGSVKEFEDTVIFAQNTQGEPSYWIGMLFPKETAVPKSLSYADLPGGSLGVCFLRGNKSERHLFSPKALRLSCDTLKSFQYTPYFSESEDAEGHWRFEIYDNEKFNTPDDTGRACLGHAFYLQSPQAESITIKLSAQTKSKLLEVPACANILSTEPFSTKEYVQDDFMLCALSVLAIKANNINSKTQFYCREKKQRCSFCRSCEMFKTEFSTGFRIYIYQLLTVCGGSAFLWSDNGIHIEAEPHPPLPDRLLYIMKAAGLEFKLLVNAPQKTIRAEIGAALFKGLPVAVKFKQAYDWAVITGMSADGTLLYGLDSYSHPDKTEASKARTRMENNMFCTDNLNGGISVIVVPTGTCPQMSLNEILKRCAQAMQVANEQNAEKSIEIILNDITTETARNAAQEINKLVQYTAQSRWQAAAAFGNVLPVKTADEAVISALCDIADIFEQAVQICRQIWGVIGVGPHTNYGLPNLIVPMMQEKERIVSLKECFNSLFSLQEIARERILKLIDKM